MFVTFEGPEGAGKSTVLRDVAARLQGDGHEILTTREPGAGELGAGIRALLLHGGDMPPKSELFLFLADRANHVERIIRPALQEGRHVLCDRYSDSTLVYQAYARGLDAEFVRSANAFATGGLDPDLTILLDLPPEVGLSRISNRDRLDAEPIEFHRKVREGFLAEALRQPDRWLVVSADAPLADVAARVYEALSFRLSSG
jgi:dTMP kinase